MASIKIAGTVNDSIVDGEGFRFTIFTQGCPHHCPGCHNPQTHSIDSGKFVDIKILLNKICQNPLLTGVTFSGGEPFLQARALAILGKKLHKHRLDITTYTGYTLEELLHMNDKDINNLLDVTDILIDGPFLLAQKDLTLTFRGSSNQRIINMNKTRSSGHIVLENF